MSAQRFRKRPVEVEAAHVDEVLRAAAADWGALPQWLRLAYESGAVRFLPDAVVIRTLEGEMRADHGWWIIRGVKGELYPCRPDIFADTYERVEVTA